MKIIAQERRPSPWNTVGDVMDSDRRIKRRENVVMRFHVTRQRSSGGRDRRSVQGQM